MVDLGCGTGILPIVLSENGGYKGKVFAIDNQAGAIEATKMNSKIFGMDSRVSTLEADIVDLYYKDMEKPEATRTDQTKEVAFYRKLSKDLGYPFTVDLILCNPPWIPAQYVTEISPLDNGVYDPQEKFLKSAFNFSRLHLDKTKGEMLLIYSDLAY